MDSNSYIFLGVGVALSILGFFLKKEARKASELDERVKALEIMTAKNEVRDSERWNQTNKLLEDRRLDVAKLYDRIGKMR